MTTLETSEAQLKSMENPSEIDRRAGAVHLLRDLIRERLGLALNHSEGEAFIVNRLADRVKQKGCESLLEYYYLLMSNGAEEEWRHVMAAFAKSKSGFWRHQAAVRILVDALPRLLSMSGDKPLLIWSASCSTGEEPLSIAIALNEAGWFERAQIEIRASDANHTAIERAALGVYPEQKVQVLDVQIRDRYFKREQDGWRVASTLHSRIQWRVANIMNSSEVADLAGSHVIFCRNVFIYFSGHAICKTLTLFGRCMPPGAYLFSDGGEFFTTLVASSKLFAPLNVKESEVWIRRDITALDQ
jgi:chemotaxis protein methyltransferase CheR